MQNWMSADILRKKAVIMLVHTTRALSCNSSTNVLHSERRLKREKVQNTLPARRLEMRNHSLGELGKLHGRCENYKTRAVSFGFEN